MKPIITKLKNNLTVVYYRQPEFSNVYLNLFFPLGSINDRKGTSGITHFSEHLIWRNSTNYFKTHNKKEYISENLFGYSYKNHTDFELLIPKSDVKKALIIFERIVNNPFSFSKSDFDLEGKIVIEEILEEYSDSVIQEYLYDIEKIFFKDNPLSNRSLGDKKFISKVGEKYIRNFIKDNFVSSNATFVVVGELGDNRNMLKTINQLGNGKSKPIVNPISEINFPKETISLKAKKTFQNYFGLFFFFDKLQTIKESTEWFFIIKSLESFLFERVRDKGYCYSLDVQSIIINDTRDLSIEANFDKKKTDGYYNALTRALSDFPKELEKKFTQYKDKETFRLMIDTDDIYEQGRLLVWSYVNFGKVLSLEEKLTIVKNTRVKDIKEYIEKNFAGKKGTLIMRGSLTKKQKSQIQKTWSAGIL